MAFEPISPELVLIDPELGARARAALPQPMLGPPPRVPAPVSAPAALPEEPAREGGRGRYPLWARITAALWILVVGILIGGAAIPHAQDQPRLESPDENVPAAVCKKPSTTPVNPPHSVFPGFEPSKPVP